MCEIKSPRAASWRSWLLVLAVTLWNGVLVAQDGAWTEPWQLYDSSSAPSSVAHDTVGGLRLLGSVRLPARFPDGSPVAELSGLAWDSSGQVLYAISDQGYLLAFDLILANGRLTDLRPRFSVPLRDRRGEVLSGRDADAEGLVYDPQCSCLWVSFERHPRIWAYHPDGRYIRSARLPKRLRKGKYYRSSNTQLEALGLGSLPGSGEHPARLVTLAEKPMRDDPPGEISVWGIDREGDQSSGSNARLGLYPLASRDSAVVAIKATGQGDWLVLEREFRSLWVPLKIHLRRVALRHGKQSLDVHNVASFENSNGWMIDNFEGLTRLSGNTWLMVSDDNANAYQSTVLTLFELMPEASPE